jgi:hypothetical protein
MSLNNKISNILGTALPNWLISQLNKRANELGQDARDNDNILYLANKSAWVRVISSIDIINPSDLNYFQRELGPNIQKPQDLAKEFVLFGGTSKYLNQNSYQQRAGLGKDGSYGMLGDSEVQKYGFRPMPGIQSVSIDTQGTLGSLRLATVNFKCWDKAQLDIIDALYFKLGFTMFLEWGHTVFYPNESNTIESTELYSIDPFRENLSKEEIALQITKNILQSDGNYDAMIGIVTNFNFSYNQEGGYDCMIKIMGLGVLGDSIKINNPTALPSLLPEEIVALNNRLLEFAREDARKAAAAAAAAASATAATTAATEQAQKPLTLDQILLGPNLNRKVDFVQRTGAFTLTDPTSKTQTTGLAYTPSNQGRTFEKSDLVYNIPSVGRVFILRRLKGFIPLDIPASTTKIKFDANRIQEIFKNNTTDSIYTDNSWEELGFFESIFSAFGANKIDDKEIKEDSENKSLVASIKYRSQNNQNYRIGFRRNSRAEPVPLEDPSITILTKDTPILIGEFANLITEALKNNEFDITSINVNDADIQKLNDSARTQVSYPRVEFTIETTITINKDLEIQKIVGNTATGITTQKEILSNQAYSLPVTIVFDDTSFIKSFTVTETPTNFVQPSDYINSLTAQNQVQNPAAATVTDPPPAEPQPPTINQIKQSLQYQSGLELTLKTIQVHALNRAINTKGRDIGGLVFPLDMTTDKVGSSFFYNQIFSVGIFSKFINELVNDQITESDDLFKVQSKYGFATEFMAGRTTIKDLNDNNSKVNFKQLLTAYVVPYEISQEIVSGINATHPVYIPFGLLIMILNNICTIYDTKNDKQQTPLVYIDFNPNLNFFLSNTKHLSTNPFKVLIPYEGSSEDYKSLFPDEILNKDRTSILPLSGSTEQVPLFDKGNKDSLSPQLPKVKYDGLENNNYRAKLMNVLLNIDYVTEVIKQNSVKEGSNSVYLKPFLEQILLDINKYLGDFNSLRLAYNDGANTFHIVDDQVAPPLPGDQILEPDNKTQIPLVGRFGLAKNLEIKSEVSTKLANMIAISANADVANKATLSTNGDSFGFINTSYKDRYIPVKSDLSSSFDPKRGQLDGLKSTAAQFNKTISDFYETFEASEANVDQATNYYIERMSKIKNNEYPTRASTMIPVSVNFTMDGIAGLTMGQAFSISDELLPYTYNNRVVQSEPGLSRDHVNKVGFTIVGLTNTIENNTWNTSVKANMIFLKYATEFSGSVKEVVGVVKPKQTQLLGLDGNTSTVGIIKGIIEARPYTEEELIKYVIIETEGGYFNPWMYQEDRVKFKKFDISGETMFGFDRLRNSKVNTPEGKRFWALIDAQKPNENRQVWRYGYIPPEPLASQLLDIVVKQETDKFREYFNRYIKNKDLQTLIKTDGRLYYNFAKATFNGAGFFQGFSNSITRAYNAGEKSTEALLKLFIELRLDIYKVPELSRYRQEARELIAQGGRRIAKQVGVQIG